MTTGPTTYSLASIGGNEKVFARGDAFLVASTPIYAGDGSLSSTDTQVIAVFDAGATVNDGATYLAQQVVTTLNGATT